MLVFGVANMLIALIELGVAIRLLFPDLGGLAEEIAGFILFCCLTSLECRLSDYWSILVNTSKVNGGFFSSLSF